MLFQHVAGRILTKNLKQGARSFHVYLKTPSSAEKSPLKLDYGVWSLQMPRSLLASRDASASSFEYSQAALDQGEGHIPDGWDRS